MLRVLYAFLSVSGLGIVLGIGLAFAAKLLHVIKDERIEAVEGFLPGLNCGACGYAGCSAYAEAIVKEEAELGLCTPGGPATATEISEYMGVEFSGLAEKQVTQVICGIPIHVIYHKKFQYFFGMETSLIMVVYILI